MKKTLDQSVTFQQRILAAVHHLPASQEAEERIIKIVESIAEEMKQQSTLKSTQQGKWSRFAERIHQESPLRGLSEYVQKCSKEFREDFALSRDEA